MSKELTAFERKLSKRFLKFEDYLDSFLDNEINLLHQDERRLMSDYLILKASNLLTSLKTKHKRRF